MQLRDYQVKASLMTRKALAKHRKVILNLPTGGGKTVVAGDICHKAHSGDFKPVFLTDRIEIAEKTYETFTQEFGLNCQLVDANTDIIWKADCYIAMAETFYRRCMKGRFPMHVIKLLFCDEAHMKVFNKTIDLFPQSYIIGLTATPLSNSFNMRDVYNEIVVAGTTSNLINRGYLCRAVEFGHAEYIQMKSTSGSDYSTKEQREAFSQYGIDKKGIELWKRFCSQDATLCYNIDIEHNHLMAEKFREMGISCAEVTSKTDDEERKQIFRDYKDGKLQVVCNVDVATKGFDAPITACILFNKITKSMNTWRQATGRGGRIHAAKPDNVFRIIDTGNNVDRLGSFNDDIDWEYLFNNPEFDVKKTTKPHKHLCPTCYQYIDNIHIPFCGICNTPISLKTLIKLESQMPDSLKDKDMKDMTLKELQIYGKFKGHKPGWAWFQHQANTRKSWNQRKNW